MRFSSLSNLAAQLLVAQVDGATYALKVELLEHLLSIVVVFLRKGQNGHLIGSEPEGEVATGVLDEHGAETLE